MRLLGDAAERQMIVCELIIILLLSTRRRSRANVFCLSVSFVCSFLLLLQQLRKSYLKISAAGRPRGTPARPHETSPRDACASTWDVHTGRLRVHTRRPRGMPARPHGMPARPHETSTWDARLSTRDVHTGRLLPPVAPDCLPLMTSRLCSDMNNLVTVSIS